MERRKTLKFEKVKIGLQCVHVPETLPFMEVKS